jgi:hypothetical protein
MCHLDGRQLDNRRGKQFLWRSSKNSALTSVTVRRLSQRELVEDIGLFLFTITCQ